MNKFNHQNLIELNPRQLSQKGSTSVERILDKSLCSGNIDFLNYRIRKRTLNMVNNLN